MRGLTPAVLGACALLFLSVPAARAQTGIVADTAAYTAAMNRAQTDEQDALSTDAFAAYCAALAAYPAATPPRSALARLAASAPPTRVDLKALRALPADALPFEIPDVPLRDAETLLFVPKASDSQPELTDPQTGWPFDHATAVYRALPGEPARLFCVVHYQGLDDQRLATRVGSLLSLIQSAYTRKMAVPRADGEAVFHVWLCRRAPETNGGEQWRNNLYFYSVGDERSSIEWIREIAHEYSHLAFAGIGGDYTDPEAWANGYIGERLLVRWLARGAAGNPADIERIWGGTFSGYPNFERILITPALALFHEHGVNQIWLARRDADGMRYLIGLFLAADDLSDGSGASSLDQALIAKKETDPNVLYPLARAMLAENGGESLRTGNACTAHAPMTTIHAHAKINWTLDVLGRRSDGYHEIASIMQTLDLHDVLTITRIPSGIVLDVIGPEAQGVPADERNLVWRAARALGADGLRISIEKNIPSQAGLGGGSSDAAAAMIAINRLLDLGRSRGELSSLAQTLGADVAFFLTGARRAPRELASA